MRIFLFLALVCLWGCQTRQADIQVLGVQNGIEVKNAETTTLEPKEFVVNGGIGSTQVIYEDEWGKRRAATSNTVRVPIEKVCDKPIEPPPLVIPEIVPMIIPKAFDVEVQSFPSHILASTQRVPTVDFKTEVFAPAKPPRIKLTKSTDEDKLCCDREMTFRLKYKNIGGDDAYNVDISDIVPQNVAYLEDTAGADPYTAQIQIDRDADAIAKRLTWRIAGPIPPQGEGEVYYTVVCPKPMPKLSCYVRFEPVFLAVGDEGKVICQVRNTGNGVALDVTATITIPPNIEYQGSSTGMEVTLPMGNIEPMDNVEKSIVVRMRTGGRLDDITANVSASNAVGCDCLVPPAPTLTIDKEGPAQLNNRVPMEYTIVVKNTTPKNASATNCMLTDKLPAFTDFKSASMDGIYNATDHTVTWSLGNLKPGDMASRTVVVIPQKEGDFVDFAQVSCDEGILVTDTAKTYVRGIPALGVSQYDTEDPVEAGQSTTYVIEIVNEGFKNATDLQLIDEIPVGSEFVEAQGRDGAGEIISYEVVEGKVTFAKYPSLPPNAKLLYKVTVKAKTGGNLLNVAGVSYNEFTKTIIVEEPTHSYNP